MLHKGLTDGLEHPRCKRIEESGFRVVSKFDLPMQPSGWGSFKRPAPGTCPRHPHFVGFRSVTMGIWSF